MSVNYSLAHMSSKPGDDTAPKLFYAKAQATGEVTMDEMAEDIAYSTSLTDGDVLNAIRALIKQVNKHLAAGKIVKPIKAATRAGDGGLTFKRVAKKGEAALPDDGNGGNSGGDGGIEDDPLG